MHEPQSLSWNPLHQLTASWLNKVTCDCSYFALLCSTAAVSRADYTNVRNAPRPQVVICTRCEHAVHMCRCHKQLLWHNHIFLALLSITRMCDIIAWWSCKFQCHSAQEQNLNPKPKLPCVLQCMTTCTRTTRNRSTHTHICMLVNTGERWEQASTIANYKT